MEPASNYGGIPGGAKVLLAISMMMGRLELYTVLRAPEPDVLPAGVGETPHGYTPAASGNHNNDKELARRQLIAK